MKIKLLFSISILAIFFVSSSFTDSHRYDDKLFRYVDRIVRLVKWQDHLAEEYFIIGYMGDHYLYKISNSYFRGKTYHNKPIVVENYHSIDQIQQHSPRLLYIGKHKQDHIEDIHSVCSTNHIFSISDDQTLKELKHPLVLLHLQGDDVQMTVNRTEAEKQHFKLSYHLLRAAKEIK